MPEDDLFKLPRLYLDAALRNERSAPLDPAQAHYFKNVLRRQDGQQVRVFNGRDGEWLGALENLSKKGGDVRLARQLRPQPPAPRPVHLYFAPIKKSAMDWLVEKAVELGATDLHPVVTQNTEIRKIAGDRLERQILEAAEQCERLDRPALHPLLPLDAALRTDIPVLACLERRDAAPVAAAVPGAGAVGLLIGPEGGFTAEEKEKIAALPHSVAVSLGDTVLRSETAAAYALIAVRIRSEQSS